MTGKIEGLIPGGQFERPPVNPRKFLQVYSMEGGETKHSGGKSYKSGSFRNPITTVKSFFFLLQSTYRAVRIPLEKMLRLKSSEFALESHEFSCFPTKQNCEIQSARALKADILNRLGFSR